jgi:cytochrome o ubiquinol oxidase subunit 1
MVTFVLGGLTGVLLAVPPADFVLHNSLFLIAHFHNVIIGGVVFGIIAGYNYWFPKAFGFTLDERLGKAVFWCWFFGFYLAFMPLYVLGFMGATRRMQHYTDPSWQPYMIAAFCGAVLIFFGICLMVIQLWWSIRTREQRRDLSGDPWNGRTLEWGTASPPPSWNYAVEPHVHGIDAFWAVKTKNKELHKVAETRYEAEHQPHYETIHMPKRSATGFITAFFAVFLGFGLIWHIWWLAIIAIIGCMAVLLRQAWDMDRDRLISAAELEDFDRHRPSLGAQR